MRFEQYYLDCLSHASYLIGDESSGRAVVVDPQRDVSAYLADAEEYGLHIERVVETHFHADFLSGHLELAAHTGAKISYGPGAVAEFPIEVLSHGTRLVLGDVVLEILHTPGHTPESICVVVYEHADDDVPYGVLTGDTLFIGDVGRPDLLSSVGVTADTLGRQLYHSTRDHLLTLPDATRVFPAHGAGSACGKQLSTATVSTIGEQRRTNYALADMTEEQFVAAVTEGQPIAPLYFSFSARANRESHALLDDAETPQAIDFDALDAARRDGAVVLDARDASEFSLAHLRGAINVGLGGRFAEYAGDVLRPGVPIALITEAGYEREARVRLARIGYDSVVGVLDDPTRAFVEHPDAVERSSRLTVAEFTERRAGLPGLQVLDIRNPGELTGGAIPGALSIPLPRLLDGMAKLVADAPVVVYCAGGYRSSIAASVLSAAGFADVSDLIGGVDAWRAAGGALVPVEPGS